MNGKILINNALQNQSNSDFKQLSEKVKQVQNFFWKYDRYDKPSAANKEIKMILQFSIK